MMKCYENSAQCSGECRMVQMRIPMTVNRFYLEAVALCAACRKALKGQWRYFKR